MRGLNDLSYRHRIISKLSNLERIIPRRRTILVRSCIATIVLLVINTIVFHRNPRSPLNFLGESERKEFHDRVVDAGVRFVSTQSTRMPSSESLIPDIALSIMTTKRTVPYVHIWFWSLITGNMPEELARTRVIFNNLEAPSTAHIQLEPFRNDPSITIRDVYDEPAPEPATFEQWLAADSSSPARQSLDDYENWLILQKKYHWRLSQANGHIIAIESCLDTGAPWCIIFEDDALLTRRFLSKVRRLIAQQQQIHSPEPYCMMKLFVGDFLGIPNHSGPFLEHILYPLTISIALVAIGLGALLVATPYSSRQRSFRLRPYTILNLLIMVMFTYINVELFHVIVSREWFIAMMTPSEPHVEPCHEEASNVALLMSRDSAAALRKSLLEVINSDPSRLPPIDLVAFDLLNASPDWQMVQSRPSIVQHIGAATSNPQGVAWTRYKRVDTLFQFE